MLHQQLRRDGVFLTEEQKTTICELYRDNVEVREICVRFKITSQALRLLLLQRKIEPRKTENAQKMSPGQMKRLQWNQTQLPKGVKNKIMRLRSRGETYVSIAKEVGLTRGVVKRFIDGRMKE